MDRSAKKAQNLGTEMPMCWQDMAYKDYSNPFPHPKLFSNTLKTKSTVVQESLWLCKTKDQ